MDDYQIQLRSLNEVCYCEKLFYLMYVKGIFYESGDTIDGKHHHNKREKSSGKKQIEGQNVLDLILYGMEGCLSAKLDGVVKENDEYIPVEDKNSKQPEGDTESELFGVKIHTEAWLNDFPQIVGQMYLLRKNHYNCNRGRIYYRGSNSVVNVDYLPIYDSLIENGVRHCINLMKGVEPKPLVNSDKCIRCSLNWACLPDETNVIQDKIDEPRRLFPGRPDAGILYVTNNGGKIGKSGECLCIYMQDKESESIPLKDIEQVCIFGNVQITTQAISALFAKGSSVFFFSSTGWLNGIACPPVSKNIYLRMAQFRKFEDIDYRCSLIRSIIFAKISNQRTLLRRNRKDDITDTLKMLAIEKKKVLECTDIDSIRGYEGNAARYYWDEFPVIFKDADLWKMNGRSKRPPKDAVNAMLSYGYSLLLRDFISAIIECGMDHMYGFFHSIVPGRPALALDLMEPYRPLIVDSVVLRIVNEKILLPSDFVETSSGVVMKPEARKRLIYMYERRMDEMITHPDFGYRLSYRRMLNLEVRLFGKYLLGEFGKYMPLITR